MYSEILDKHHISGQILIFLNGFVANRHDCASGCQTKVHIYILGQVSQIFQTIHFGVKNWHECSTLQTPEQPLFALAGHQGSWRRGGNACSYEHWRETQWPDNKARCGSERNILVLEDNDSNKLNGNNMPSTSFIWFWEKSSLRSP